MTGIGGVTTFLCRRKKEAVHAEVCWASASPPPVRVVIVTNICAGQVANSGFGRGRAVAGRFGSGGPTCGDDPGDEGDPNRIIVQEAAEPAQAADSAVIFGAADDERLRYHLRYRQHMCVRLIRH